MKFRFGLVPALLLSGTAANAANYAFDTGFVTPNEVTLTVTALNLFTEEGIGFTIWSGSKDVTFKRSGKSLEFAEFDNIEVKPGRYFGINIGIGRGWKVKLDGAKYFGKTTANLTHGDKLYSVGTKAMVGGAISKTAATATTLTDLDEAALAKGNISGNSYSTQIMWKTPICVTVDKDDSAAICKKGDERVYPGSEDKVETSGSAEDPTVTTVEKIFVKSATLNLAFDLSHSVAVDGNTMALALTGNYPYAGFGDLAAVMHLTGAGANGLGQTDDYVGMSLVFDKNKNIVGIKGTASSHFNSNSKVYMRDGWASVAPSTQPADVIIPKEGGGTTFVATFNADTGILQFPVSAGVGSNGTITLDNVKQSVGGTVKWDCDANVTSLAGYTWNKGPNSCINMGTNTSGTNYAPDYAIVRIYDPGNLFAVCSATSPGYSAATGACSVASGAYASDTDGYL